MRWLWWAIRDRIAPLHPELLPTAQAALVGKSGLEIGGPSRIFRPRGALPAYEWAACIDNVNFSAETVWEHARHDGGPYPFHRRKRPGRQWIREAANLTGIADQVYDFVLSSHCLEHLANPLAALREWRRATRPAGHLLLVVPDPARSFDHRRPMTTLGHLQADYLRRTGEDDSTHCAEVLALHDLVCDPDAGPTDEFRERVLHNADNRCLHHHVFDLALLAAALAETGWRVIAMEKVRPVHLVAFAQKEAA